MTSVLTEKLNRNSRATSGYCYLMPTCLSYVTTSDTQIFGLVCNVDLFPVHSVDAERELKPRKPSATQHVTGFPSSNFPPPSGQHQSFTFVASPPYSHRASPPHSMAPAATPPQATDIVHRIGDSPITESSKRTSDLVGATFVQPSKIDWNGKKMLIFVFAVRITSYPLDPACISIILQDLAVKIEGSFILRYRAFDIFSRPLGQDNLTIQAECYGDQFRVYSTKEFPGLQASTELTKVQIS
jgi:hypothetical protein